MCSRIFIIHNDHTYITEDYTSLCLNIICNRSFFYFEMMSAFFRFEFYTRMKRYWGENIYLPHAQTAIYDSKVKLFLERNIPSPWSWLNAVVRFWMREFSNWWLIFYEKYSTSLSYLWFWPPLILGGSVISAGTMHDLGRVKVPGTGPLWNPCTRRWKTGRPNYSVNKKTRPRKLHNEI